MPKWDCKVININGKNDKKLHFFRNFHDNIDSSRFFQKSVGSCTRKHLNNNGVLGLWASGYNYKFKVMLYFNWRNNIFYYFCGKFNI